MSWSYVISIISLVLMFFSFLYFRSYIKKRTSFDGILKDVREEVSRLLRSIDDITDKDISLIEDREKQLKQLLEETDKRLSLYGRELDRREQAEKKYRELGRLGGTETLKVQVLNPEPVPPPAPPPLEEQIREMARSGIEPYVIASRLGISVSEAELAVAIEARKKA